MTNNTFAADLREMMAAWNRIESAARKAFPNATAEELHRICSDAMSHSLKVAR